MKKITSLIIAAAIALGLVRLCVYTVGEREYALVFALGELVDVKSEPGLYVKMPAPLQNVVYLDRRILTMDTPQADLVQTSEKKNLLIDSFVKWRIQDPRSYWVSFIGSERAAEDRVAALLRDVLNQTVNRAVDAFHHKEPVWYYLKTIWYSLAPWILLYVAAIILGIRKHLINTDLKRFFVVIITTTFIALSIFSGKLDIYMLPIFPFIAYLAFLLLPALKGGWLKAAVGLPAVLLVLAFPGYFIVLHYVTLPVEPTWLYPAATFILSAGAAIALYQLYRQQLLRAINSLAVGLLLTVFVGSFALPPLNPYMGFRAMSEKAQSIAHEEGISTYYYYPFRSAENIDAYIGCSLQPLEAEEIAARDGKERFILFVKERDRREKADLQAAIAGHTEYRFGDYSVIVFK